MILPRRLVLLAPFAAATAVAAQDEPTSSQSTSQPGVRPSLPPSLPPALQPTLPLGDVDITYVIPAPAGAARQRLRYSAANRLLRIDPPGTGLYIVIDFAANRMFTVRDADRSIIDMAAPKSWMPGQGHGHYTRRNRTEVSGVPCTEWQTTDSEGRDVLICFDDQGDMLRAAAQTPRGEAVLALATELRHETQDLSVFHIPDGYRRLSPPPIPRAQ